MTQLGDFFARDWKTLAVPAGVLICVFAAGWLVRRLLVRTIRAWARRTRTQLDDLIIQALHGPFLLWVLILASHLAAQSSDLPARAIGVVGKILLILWIVSLTLVAARLAGALIRHYGNNISSALPVTTITQNLASLAVVAAGLLILLNSLGVSITPILTALGVGGLAVALALQDTLLNLFAGFYMSLAGQVRAGDYVKLDSGEEGYVTDIACAAPPSEPFPTT